MIPEWLNNTDKYVPPREGGTFVIKTIKSIGQVMARLRVQKGHEKNVILPAIVKLLLTVLLILVISISRNKFLILTVITLVQLYLCMWPGKDIWNIIKASLFAMIIAFIIFIPAMIMNPAGIYNNLLVIVRVFVSVEILSIFNHTTQWNHITQSLRRLHVPPIVVFTLDITLKYIVLLGNLINDMLTAMSLRMVGKNNKEYQSIGGVMGTTIVKSTQMSKEMYEAMKCRGFTDDYKGL